MSNSDSQFFLPDFSNVGAVLFLVLVAELLALVLALASHPGSGFSWVELAMTSLFSQWVVLSSASILGVIRPALMRLGVASAAGISYLIVLAMTLLTSLAGQGLLLPAGASRTPAQVWAHIDAWQTLDHVLIASVFAGIALRYFYLQQQLRRQREAELQARIEALQARIRPHFLFNSMNIIASLIATDPDLAERVVEDLADLFRQSLAPGGTEVHLGEEIDLCRRFARIESLRLGDRLKVHWDIGAIPPGLKIPRFTLQPLLENAIYHGIQPLPDGGVIRVAVRCERSNCVLEVVNPMAPTGTTHRGNHMALDNIAGRLESLYGDGASLTVVRDPRQFAVCICYPFDGLGAAA